MIRVGQTQMRFEPVKGMVEIDLSKDERFHDLVGKSVRMREIFATLEKVAPTELTCLVRGETGTGKELVARAVHRARAARARRWWSRTARRSPRT